MGSRCDENTGNCVCLPYFIGNPAMLCVPRKYTLSISMKFFSYIIDQNYFEFYDKELLNTISLKFTFIISSVGWSV